MFRKIKYFISLLAPDSLVCEWSNYSIHIPWFHFPCSHHPLVFHLLICTHRKFYTRVNNFPNDMWQALPHRDFDNDGQTCLFTITRRLIATSGRNWKPIHTELVSLPVVIRAWPKCSVCWLSGGSCHSLMRINMLSWQKQTAVWEWMTLTHLSSTEETQVLLAGLPPESFLRGGQEGVQGPVNLEVKHQNQKPF